MEIGHINLPLSYSSRSIESLNEDIRELESYVDQIDTGLYVEFKISSKKFKDPFIFTVGKDTRETCNKIYRKYIYFIFLVYSVIQNNVS